MRSRRIAAACICVRHRARGRLGWRAVKRLLVLTTLLLPVSAASAAAADFVVAGYGWGHGVGMSQWGAEGYAVHGWGWKRILAHYYPGTTLLRERPRTVRVLLAEGKASVVVASRAPFVVRDGKGTRVRLVAGRHTLGAGLRLEGKRLAAPVRFVPGLA